MSRERFEKLFPVPEWAAFNGAGYVNPDRNELDPATNLVREAALDLVNSRFAAWQARQPEIDELTAEAGKADLCLQAVSAAREALADHFNGNLAFLDDDLLRGVVLMKAQVDELVEALEMARGELLDYADDDAIASGHGGGCRSNPYESIRPTIERLDALIAKHKGEA